MNDPVETKLTVFVQIRTILVFQNVEQRMEGISDRPGLIPGLPVLVVAYTCSSS